MKISDLIGCSYKVTPPDYRIVHQVVTFPAGVKEGLYWTGALVQSDTPIQIAWRAKPSAIPQPQASIPYQGETWLEVYYPPRVRMHHANYTVIFIAECE